MALRQRSARLVLVVAVVMAATAWRAAPATPRSLLSGDPYSYHIVRREKLDQTTAARCQDVLGWPQLYIMWENQSEKNAQRFIHFLKHFRGMRILEVHRMQFSSHSSKFAQCHLQFYQNNQCGKIPSYTKAFHKQEYLERSKGTGPFTVILYAFDCAEAAKNHDISGKENKWGGHYLSFIRFFKRRVRDVFSTGSQYTIHGTQNKLEAMIDIHSLFGPDKYQQLADDAAAGGKWDGQSEMVHESSVCPKVREDPCGSLFSAVPGLEELTHMSMHEGGKGK
eukprot:jgi/Tetstr1/423186/TSEL_001306.t1